MEITTYHTQLLSMIMLENRILSELKQNTQHLGILSESIPGHTPT